MLLWKNFGPVMLPPLLLMPLFGLPNVGWFSTLKPSARNYRYCSRQVGKLLNSDIFTW